MLNFVISHRERRWQRRQWAEKKILRSRTKKLARETEMISFSFSRFLFLPVRIHFYICTLKPYIYVYAATLCLYITKFRLYATNDLDRIEIESGFLRFAISGTDCSRGPVRTLYGFVADPPIYPSIYSRLWLTYPASLFSRFSQTAEKDDWCFLIEFFKLYLYYIHVTRFVRLDMYSFSRFLNIFIFVNLYSLNKCTIQKWKILKI